MLVTAMIIMMTMNFVSDADDYDVDNDDDERFFFFFYTLLILCGNRIGRIASSWVFLGTAAARATLPSPLSVRGVSVFTWEKL